MRPIGPSSPMRSDGAAAQPLGGRAIGEVGRVALARVEDRPAFARNRAISAATVGTIAATGAKIVAERLAEAAGLDEIALHVDDDERDMFGVEREGERARRRHRSCAQCPAMWRPMVVRSAPAAGVR